MSDGTHREVEDRTALSTGERDLQRTIAHIHAVAKHLLGLRMGDTDELYVSVQPLGHSWRVQVRYASFELTTRSPSLNNALNMTLQNLMNHVSAKLEESTRIIAALRGHVGEGTSKSIDTTVRAVPMVLACEVVETIEPGVVEVYVTPERPQTLDERDEMIAAVSAALERIRPPGARYKIKVSGMVALS